MPVTFIPDPHKGPGYGILLISPMQCENAPTFALTNASTRQCLSPTGWQSAEVFLEPDAWDCTNEQLRLAVGPHVVDNLDSLDMYKLQLKDDAGNIISYGLTIDDIVQSSMVGGQGLATAVATAPKVEPTPEPEPLVLEPQPEPQPMPEVEMAPEQPAKKSSLPLILGIVILCALLGAGLWWYLQKQTPVTEENATQTEESAASTDEKATEEKTEQKEEQSSEAKPEEQTQEAEQKTTAPQSTDQSGKQSEEQGSTPATPAQIRPMDSARALLRTNDTGEKSQSLAAELRSKAPDDAAAQDAVFLLFEDAAQKGVSSAMSELAGYYDPSNTAPKGSISPDVEQAYTWYQKAQQSGDVKAQEHLARLKSWAEEQAPKGNSEAKKLLNLWK